MKIQTYLEFGKQKVGTFALIDCGAKGASYVDHSFVTKHQIPRIRLKKTIPILNVDGTENQGGHIFNYVDVTIEVRGRKSKMPLLITSLGAETVILGYPWLRQENPNIDWKNKTLSWRKGESHRIKHIDMTEPFELIFDTSLAISAIKGKLTDKQEKTG